MIYLLMKLKFISENDNGLEFELKCKIHHGPQWNVEFSIPIQAVTGTLLIFAHFAHFAQNKIFSSKLAFD